MSEQEHHRIGPVIPGTPLYRMLQIVADWEAENAKNAGEEAGDSGSEAADPTAL